MDNIMLENKQDCAEKVRDNKSAAGNQEQVAAVSGPGELYGDLASDCVLSDILNLH